MSIRLPAPVARALREIRRRHRHASVSRIRNGYYVVESVSRYSERRGRRMTFTLYLGRILADGRFVEARHRKARNEVGSVYRLAEAGHGGEEALDALDYMVLEELSADSRVPAAEMASRLGISAGSANYRIGKLEKRFGIRYVAEFETAEFGFSRFAVMVKFESERPSNEEMRGALGSEPLVLSAFETKGAYDLFVIVLAESTVALEKWLYGLKTSKLFAKYTSRWTVSYITTEQGYIPVREEFVRMLGERVWHRSRESPVRGPGQLLDREHAVLEELCRDANADFSEMDRRHGFGKGASQYTYHRLVEKGLVTRTTINMDRPPVKYTAIIHADQENMGAFSDGRERFFLMTVTDMGTALNKYALVCGYGTPYGELIFAPVREGGDLERYEAELRSIIGLRVSSTMITSEIVGGLGFRRLVHMGTPPYSSLIKQYGYTEERLARLVRSAPP